MSLRSILKRSSQLTGPAAALLVIVAPHTAFAQTSAGDDQAGQIEEVVVTAERRSVDLMEAPLAASVLSQTDIEHRGITNLDSLQFNTPSLTVNDYGGGNLLNIRGIGRTEPVTQASAGVPVYRDGLATFNAYFAASEPYFDINNIQVLRGPQGTFAGQDATGGAIFVTTNNPDLAGVGGYAQLQAGTYDDLAAQGAINLPLSDTLAVRFAGDAELRKNFYNYSGPYTGHPNRLVRTAGRASILWQPTSQFQAIVKVDYDYNDPGAHTYAPVAAPGGIYNVSSNADLYAFDRFVRVGGTLAYTFNDGTVLKSVTGYQHGLTKQKSDSDGTAFGNLTLEYRAIENIVSQEFNLISPDNKRFKYVLGAYYSDDTVHLPQFLVSVPPTVIGIVSELKRKNRAAFAHFTYDVTPKFQVELGGRYNHSVVRQNLNTLITFAGFPIAAIPGPSKIPADNKLTGKIGASYQFNANNFLYGFVATGHKNAGMNTSVFSPPSFKGETLTDFEGGYKATLMDEKLRFQLNYYHYEYKNYQFNQYDVTTRSAVILNVPGKSKSDGVEMQLNGNFGDTRFNLAASYSDSKLPNFFTVDPRNPPPVGAPACPVSGPSTSAQCIDVGGRRLPYQPHITFSGGIEHDFATSIGTFTPRVDVAYMGNQYTTVYQAPVLDTLDSRTIVNAQIRYNTGTWVATLYATNLFDEKYIAAKLSGLRVAGVPRQVGIRILKVF